MVAVGASRLTNNQYELRPEDLRPPRRGTTACDCERARGPALATDALPMTDRRSRRKLRATDNRINAPLEVEGKTDDGIFEDVPGNDVPPPSAPREGRISQVTNGERTARIVSQIRCGR